MKIKHKEKQLSHPALLQKKVILPVLCGLLAAGGIAGAALLTASKEPDSVLVSAGVQQLAGSAYLAASAPAGQDITFSPEWFDRTLAGSPVASITVTALPPVTDGVLKLGYGEVSLGQTIPRETLSYLKFTPNDGVQKTSFSFTPTTADGNSGYALCCTLAVTTGQNCCPVEKGSVMAVFTHESLALSGTLSAEDPDGDALYFEVCSYPQNGVLTLDATTGGFTYTPSDDYCGTDTFTWRAQDENGAFSGVSTVSVTVRELTLGYTFSDITENSIQTAALRVTEAGLLGGEELGSKHYFHPKRELTRAAFVAILLDAAEIEVPEADSTGFADDAQIPKGMKGAIRYARERGWLGEEDTFRPNEAITRAEAATIAAKVLGLAAPGYTETVSDFSAIPVDVADAIYALFEGEYITTLADGSLAPAAAMTREDAARFFARILDGKDTE